jgi:hypothetical protein
MRMLLVLLAVALPWLWGVQPVLAGPRAAPDGSLILDTGKKSPREKSAPKDTLYDLLGQEVQVYVFKSKTRVFPAVYLRSGYLRSGYLGSGASWQVRYGSPQVEGLINKYGHLYGVDPALVRAVMRHESGFNPGAVSPKGAQGLMQLMPGTAALMGVRNAFDPEQNVAGGVGYLRRCLDLFGHNVPLAVAAYNAGPQRVANCGTVPPIPETQAFVSNVMGTYAGPQQMRQLPGAAGPAAAAGRTPLPGQALKKAAGQGDQESAASERPRRHRPKIIEVRSSRPKTADTHPD